MTLLTLWRVGVVVLLGLASMGLWLRPPVRVEQVDCVETWKRLGNLEEVAQRKFVDVMLAEAAKLRAWEDPMTEMKRIKLRPLQEAVHAAESDAQAKRQVAIADAEAEVARRRQALQQEERATYSRAEALAFLRARGIPLREHP